MDFTFCLIGPHFGTRQLTTPQPPWEREMGWDGESLIFNICNGVRCGEAGVEPICHVGEGERSCPEQRQNDPAEDARLRCVSGERAPIPEEDVGLGGSNKERLIGGVLGVMTEG
ncbi:hypothetical protein NDU88_004505 [Pleurodeles waltl]|uniref:Uncharacterized protein n=1 Tax=Pleurodeles waltl TaxID=8319 RepID=A0AAV7QEN3_PLEWA|nr:hypothetical protein NDU88_004505 [Pleurodeles waltl]